MSVDEASVTQTALRAEQSERMTRGAKVPMPGGSRVSAAPYIGVRYPGGNDTLLLGDPKQILKRPNRDSVYLWRKRDEAKTGSMVRAQVIRPVQMDEVDPDCEFAAVVEHVAPSGSYVTWENMALFEMPSAHVPRHYTDYEKWAIARIAQEEAAFEEKVEAATGGAFKGSTKRQG